MTNKINPFTPNSPVHRDTFAGRAIEITAIDKGLLQAKHGNPTHILFHGEKGIGKTSLLNVGSIFAKGEFEWEDTKHKFLVVRANLTPNMSLVDFAVPLRNAVEREISKDARLLSTIKKVWDFVSRFEAGGVAYRKEELQKNSAQIIQDFIYSLSDTVKSIKDPLLPTTEKRDGLVVLIDEADKGSHDLQLGAFLKMLTENLVAEKTNNILFIVSGLPGVRKVLSDSHESSLRLFQEFNLGPLSSKETTEVISNGLAEAEKASGIRVVIDSEAQNAIYAFSEGYPHFIQQIGYSSFEVDSDNHITKADVDEAVFMKNGALELIGNRYYVKPFYQDIAVASQREILTIMAKKWNDWITREEIKQDFSGKETALTNGLHALKEKGTIITLEKDLKDNIGFSGKVLHFGLEITKEPRDVIRSKKYHRSVFDFTLTLSSVRP